MDVRRFIGRALIVGLLVGMVPVPSHGQSVNLFEGLKPKQASVAGEWSLVGDSLQVVAGQRARCALPVEVNGSYDVSVQFTRTQGDDGIGLILPVGPRQCILNLSGWQGEVHGLALIDGKLARDNVTTRRPGTLENGRKYRVTVSVRIDGNSASIDAVLDGKPLTKWSGKLASLSLNAIWKLPVENRIGLAAFNNRVTFHRALLRPAPRRSTAVRVTLAPQPPPPSRRAPGTGPVQGKTVSFEGRQWDVSLARRVTVENFKGKKALHVTGQESAYVFLPEVDFQDGTIEVDIAGATFSGIAFRGRDGGKRAEKLYFRPQNAGTAKHENTVQYSLIGRPDGSWRALRTKFPGKYEAGADIAKDKWFHVRLEIRGKRLEAFVNDSPKPVLVVDPLLDELSRGTVGVWGWNTYFAGFTFTPAGR